MTFNIDKELITLPIHQNTIKEYNEQLRYPPSMFNNNYNIDFKTQTKQLLETYIDCYIAGIVDLANSTSKINKLGGNYIKYLHIQYANNTVLKNKLEQFKTDYKNISKDISTDNLTLDYIVNDENYYFSQLLNNIVSTEGSSTSTDTDFNNYCKNLNDPLLKVFKCLPLLLKDPMCVLPDDEENNINNNDDDDVKVAGGTIELTCPITCRPYAYPMISRKCNHVFDKDGLTNYFQSNEDGNQIKCPQGACKAYLTMSDFIKDDIMDLRCKIYKNISKKNKLNKNNDNINDVIL
ncbi:uncharacterized protein SCODWIG_01242 [Saccharomycodes ludwigii]|uniref:SP-RING-type domain-containing protein n=1 Tax=Saccharomycodes ludwigii TaxID=36035 RepID=A0A376B490_9ASCO|nr:hypothetical protein SCDLUD_003405 [Saccharomycodes ludwigii]KAH3900425.1 hypothetical protein SCDLUD_003405 [Saccharomycodes ludwigii]SSD59481.1 uncharacterized protein SCODWIG_01242 [Saccharomycodes ludwigii]